MASISKESRTCPCKLLPRSLSSFTAAEYGNLHELAKIGPSVSNRRDDFGYTPLHLAAQNNHVAATALLLHLGCHVDGGKEDTGNNNRKSCGATPLHRAAFSGATAAMKVLLEWHKNDNNNRRVMFPDRDDENSHGSNSISSRCNLLAKDTSFGDESTPLHKAAAGGRYLAVHMLLEALKEREQEVNDKRPSSILQMALQAKDKQGRTPIEVARHLSPIQDTERHSVARWDSVAGCPADWNKCVLLLEKARGRICQNPNNEKESSDMSDSICIATLPLHLRTSIDSCLDCDTSGNGKCLTASWESAFQKTLGESANMVLSTGCLITPGTTVKALTTSETTDFYNSKDEMNVHSNSVTRNTTKNESIGGIKCARCNKQSFALYPACGASALVCKRCRSLNN